MRVGLGGGEVEKVAAVQHELGDKHAEENAS